MATYIKKQKKKKKILHFKHKYIKNVKKKNVLNCFKTEQSKIKLN